MKQQKLFALTPLAFGGDSSIGKAKVARPLSVKRPLHVVMKVDSSVGALRSLKNRELCQRLIQKWSARFGIKVKARSVNTTHIHLLIKGESKSDLQNFLRVLPGQIAQKLQRKGKFWLGILYSRVIACRTQFVNTLKYIERNTLEMAGQIRYERKPCKSQRAKAGVRSGQNQGRTTDVIPRRR